MANTLDFTFNGKDKTQSAFKSLNRSVATAQENFGKLKKTLSWLSTAGGVASIATLGAMATSLSKTADRIGKVSSKLGISSEQLQKFQFSAEQSGLSTETLNMAFQRFTRRIADARAGTGTALKAFNQMGISLQGAGGQAKTAEELFFEVADSMKGIKSETDKVSLAFKFFDSEGVSLVNMLQNGSEAIIAHGEQLENYEGIIDDKAIKATERFNDALNLLAKTARGTFSDIVIFMDESFERMGRGYEKIFGKDFMNINLSDIGNKSKSFLNTLDKDLKKAFQENQKIIDTIISKQAEMNDQGKEYQKGQKVVNKLQDQNLHIFDLMLGIITELNKKQGLNLDMTKDVKDEQVDINSLLKVQVFSGAEIVKQNRITKAFTEDIVELDEKDQRIWKAKITDANGVLHVVEGLTKEESDLLVTATKNVKVHEAQNKSLETAKKLTKERKNQEEEIKKLMGEGVGMQMSLSGFIMKVLGSSKKVNKAWSEMWNMFGKAFDGLTTGWLDSTDNAEAYKKRMLEINNLIKEINTNIDDSVDSINNITSEQQALAKIEKTYQKRKSDSERLNATQLLHYAEQERIVAILAYRVGVLRNATAAFASSVQQFLDAVSTKGFTDLQKQFFSMVTGFTRSVLKDYTAVIASADAIIAKGDATAIKGRVTELQTTATSLGTFGPITGANVSQFNELSETFWKNFESLEMDETEAGKWFRKRMLELSTLGGEAGYRARSEAMLEFSTMLSTTLTTVQAQITAYNEAIKTKTDTELLMGDATKGLTIMLKDTILSEYEAGKSIEHLKIDVNALSKEFLKAGVKIEDLLDYIDSLTASGASGGLFKKYPYGGNIFGPSHSGGGVNANLEGGEFVMSRSAVNRYGSDFMSSVNNGSFGGSDQVEVSVYLDMEGQVKLPLHSYISSVTNKAERSGNPELAGILAG